MRKKHEIKIFFPVFIIVLVILFVVSCGSFEIVYAPPPKKPVERAPAQEPAKEPVPSKEVTEEAAPSEKTSEETAPPETATEEPAPPETTAEEPAPSQEIVKTTEEIAPTPKKTSAERVIEGTVRIDKNNYLIYDSRSDILYRLVGLKKEEKTRLYQLKGTSISLKIRIVSTESAKAWNAQLIKIIEESISNEKIAEVVLSERETHEKKSQEEKVAKAEQLKEKKVEKEKPVKEEKVEEKASEQKTTEKIIKEEKIVKVEQPQEKEAEKKKPVEEEKPEEKVAKAEQPKEKKVEKEKPVKEEKIEEKATSKEKQPEEITIEGVLSIDKNNYYISDLESGIQYKLVGLDKEEMKRLKKMKGKNISLEIKVVSTESEKVFNAQFVRFL